MPEDKDKTREQLLSELEALRQRTAKLEAANKKPSTARKQLKKSEAMLESIFRAAPTGIGIVTNRIIGWTNSMIHKMTGYTEKELMGQNARILYPSDEDYQYVGKEKYRQIKEHGTGTVETRWKRKDGTIIDVLLSSTPLNPDNLQEGVTFTALDITQRKRSEEELRRLRNLLSNIINSMPSILVGVDSSGRVNQWNWEAEKATGMTAREAQGHTLEQVIPQLAGEMEKIKKAIRERKPQTDEKVLLESARGTRFSDITIYPLIANGVEGAVIRVDDITERVRIEEMMIQSEKMLSVGGLAAGMAHEINNPLAGILQNIQVMENRLKNNMPKNIQAAEACGTTQETIAAYMERRGIFQMIDSIKESGKRAAKIVENMLSFSRKSESKFLPHNLCQLLDKTVELASNDYDLKKKYDFRQIEINRQYHPDMPVVLCDGTKVQQVFLNILKNGAQAMAEKKDRYKKKEKPQFILRVKPETGDQNHMARIEIQDNGAGMDENTRKRVFEPFYTTRGVGKGTGLGLSVSYFIITKNHKGAMAVESIPGEGTTFIIRLPIKGGGK